MEEGLDQLLRQGGRPMINPPDGNSQDDYVEPPLGVIKTTNLPELPALKFWSGDKVSSLGVADAREVRLILQGQLNGTSRRIYNERSVFPVEGSPVKADVIADIRLMVELLARQGPAGPELERIKELLRQGMSAGEIGDKFNIPLNTLNDTAPASGTGLSDENLKLLAAALLIVHKRSPGHEKLKQLSEAISPSKAYDIIEAAG